LPHQGEIVSRNTLGSFFLASAARRPHWPCVKRIGSVRSYADMAVSVASTVRRMRAAGIRRGDYVACYLEDQVPNLTLELACAITGVVAVPLSPLFSVDYFIDGIVRPLGVKAVLTTPALAPSLRAAGVPLWAYPEKSAAISPDVEWLRDEAMSFERAMQVLEAEAARIAPEDVFVVQPTSGSTGKPKLVVRRHRAFTRYADFVGDQLAWPESEPLSFLMVATLTHAFGLHMLTTAVKRGAALCVPSALDTAASLEEVRALDPVVLPLLPRMQAALMRQRERDDPFSDRIFGPSARYLCSAGGVADASLLERIRRTGVDIIEFYGSSEASVVALTLRGLWRPGCSGVLAPDVEARIGPDGELAVRSPGVMPGYLGDRDATKAAFDAEGYYLTGDLAEIAADRTLRILGRKRDVFNTPEGSNIYPARIEQQIESLAPVQAAVLVGDQRPYLSALVVPREPVAASGAPFLEPHAHAALYERIGAELAGVNAGLERVEKVVRFLVLGEPFHPDAYRIVGPGKVRRDRQAVGALYAEATRFLYADTQLPEPSFVPGAERRMRPHVRRQQLVREGAI